MVEVPLTRRVMAGRSVWTLPFRGVLRACSVVYGLGVARRNRRFDRGVGVCQAEVPVISVGNITTGGTGKTPLVVEIARRLSKPNRRLAVLSRGYRAERGRPADEMVLVSRRVPGALCYQSPDRVSAALQATEMEDADVILLDDGFQHRQLGRDLDVVAVDATCPFGFGHLLPRGLLREPVASLQRAGLIVVTRADQVDADSLRPLHERLDAVAPGVPRISCRHKPTGLVRLDGQPEPDLSVDRQGVLCVSAIGNPAAFESTVCDLGGNVKGHLVFGDHHRYRAEDLAPIADEVARCRADLLLTTEKDAVKLADLTFAWPCPVAAVRVDIDFLDDGDTILSATLERVVS